MPRYNFRKGPEEIKKSGEKSKSGGKFKPFAPRIALADDETKYILFLTPPEEQVVGELHEFVPIGKWESKDGKRSGNRFGFYFSRKDQAIGEDHDILEDEFGLKPRERTLGVAVELEPTFKKVKGRNKPVGFAVKTQEYTRRGDDDEEVEVTAPVVGVVTQSSANFFGYLTSYDEKTGPIVETPFQVSRRGDDKDTAYDFVPYPDQPVDLTPLVENVEEILYLDDVMDDLIEEIDDLGDEEAAASIATAILDTRLDELADPDRYVEETKGLKEIKTYNGTLKRNVEVEVEEEDEEEEEEKPRRRSRSRKAKAPEPVAEESDEDEGEDEDEDAERTEFERMRKKAQRKKATA